MLLLAALQRHLGFFGMEGPLWFFLGLFFLIAVLVVYWRLLDALGKALTVPPQWMLVLYWGFVLLCLFMFANYSVAHWF